jgi:hypothetical protein
MSSRGVDEEGDMLQNGKRGQRAVVLHRFGWERCTDVLLLVRDGQKVARGVRRENGKSERSSVSGVRRGRVEGERELGGSGQGRTGRIE